MGPKSIAPGLLPWPSFPGLRIVPFLHYACHDSCLARFSQPDKIAFRDKSFLGSKIFREWCCLVCVDKNAQELKHDFVNHFRVILKAAGTGGGPILANP